MSPWSAMTLCLRLSSLRLTNNPPNRRSWALLRVGVLFFPDFPNRSLCSASEHTGNDSRFPSGLNLAPWHNRDTCHECVRWTLSLLSLSCTHTDTHTRHTDSFYRFSQLELRVKPLAPCCTSLDPNCETTPRTTCFLSPLRSKGRRGKGFFPFSFGPNLPPKSMEEHDEG